MKASICMSTFQKAAWLERTLDSIFSQFPSFDFDVIVVDDGSHDETKEVCLSRTNMTYIEIQRELSYRNPSVARNVAYKAARGEVIICQSDDVLHGSSDTIERLVTELRPKNFNIATVYNTDENGKGVPHEGYLLTGSTCPRPFFFLGSVFRSDLYKVGGNDERYTGPGYDDNAFGNALIYGIGLHPVFTDVVGYHIDHPRPINLGALVQPSKKLYEHLLKEQQHGRESWFSKGAPWEMT